MKSTRDQAKYSTSTPGQPVVPAEELFGNAKEVTISYLGTLYRLRITRNDKLILTK